jgi:hypothetical protein
MGYGLDPKKIVFYIESQHMFLSFRKRGMEIREAFLVFRRRFWGIWDTEWNKLVDLVGKVVLRDGDDKVGWKMGHKGFTVKTLYNALQTRPPITNLNSYGPLTILFFSLANDVWEDINNR